MELLQGILTGTPIWVWLVLAYGIFMGIKALGERTVSWAPLAILPLVFLFLRVPPLLAPSATHPLVVAGTGGRWSCSLWASLFGAGP